MGKITFLKSMEVTQKKFRMKLLSFKICELKVFQKEEIITSYQHAPMKNGSYWANVLIYGVYIYLCLSTHLQPNSVCVVSYVNSSQTLDIFCC